MVRTATISILILTFTGVTAQSQNYSPFRYEAEQALLNEFGKLAQQDWQPWRQQQEWRLQQADEQDDVICRRQDQYPYSDCRAQLLAIRRDCAQGGDFFEKACD